MLWRTILVVIFRIKCADEQFFITMKFSESQWSFLCKLSSLNRWKTQFLHNYFDTRTTQTRQTLQILLRTELFVVVMSYIFIYSLLSTNLIVFLRLFVFGSHHFLSIFYCTHSNAEPTTTITKITQTHQVVPRIDAVYLFIFFFLCCCCCCFCCCCFCFVLLMFAEWKCLIRFFFLLLSYVYVQLCHSHCRRLVSMYSWQ